MRSPIPVPLSLIVKNAWKIRSACCGRNPPLPSFSLLRRTVVLARWCRAPAHSAETQARATRTRKIETDPHARKSARQRATPYVPGNTELLNNEMVSIVGARRRGYYGNQMPERLGRDLAQCGTQFGKARRENIRLPLSRLARRWISVERSWQFWGV
jgi:hypothetical protein